MFKVMIKRTIPPGKEKDVRDMITLLRSLAMKQPGYISGETLQSADNPNQYLVISIWENEKDWRAWFNSSERKALQTNVDKLVGIDTVYESYYYPNMPRTD